MGTAYYYGKLVWNESAQAEAALPEIQEFFEQGLAAEKWWQEHRQEAIGDFWPPFMLNFPDVFAFLHHAGVARGSTNDIAGVLEFGEIQPEEQDVSLDTDGAVCITAHCWHLSDWDFLFKYLAEKWGAVDFEWISEEDLSAWEAIDWRLAARNGG